MRTISSHSEFLRLKIRNTRVLAVVLLLLLVNVSVFAQKSSFVHSSPEAEGVSSASIDSFLNAASHGQHEFHSFMFIRHGKSIAEGWWNPYQSQLKHSLYSTSKSFTSTAVGFAVSEKKLTVNDKVVSFFPDQLPDTVKPYLADLTVKDLLTMSVGQDPDPTSVLPATANWVKGFLATPILNKPGSKFLYNSMATFMLSAIVQKATGQKVLDYLKPRLFDPLEIKGQDWELEPQGVNNTGGWGLRLKTEDLAKMGQLYLQKGMWKGKQILPKEWVEEATTFKIDQAPNAPQSKKDSSDWMQGYCYQFWRCRHNAFRADGAFGQYIIVMPEQDAVIAITSESPNMQEEINLVWKYLLPAMQPKGLPANKSAETALKQHLAALTLPPLASPNSKANLNGYDHKTFTFEANPLKIKSISFDLKDHVYHVTLNNESTSYKFDFDSGKWAAGTTDMMGPYLLSRSKEDFSFLQPYKVTGSYAWTDNNTLQLKLRYIESPHSETITCKLNGQQLNATVEYSFNYGKNKIELKGESK